MKRMYSGRLTISVVGERQTLWSAVQDRITRPDRQLPKFATRLIITANSDNSAVGIICVGDDEVVAAEATRTGLPLRRNEQAPEMTNMCLDAVWIDASVAGEGVLIYWEGESDD